MKSKVTVQQIADAVEMSKYAVSRALSGKSGVSEETRLLIQETALRMGYKFRNNSSSLTEVAKDTTINKVQNILVLFPSTMYKNKESIYWGPVFNGISLRLNEFKINVVTLTEPVHDSIFTLLNPDAIQGVISVGSVSNETLEYLHGLAIPIVIVDHKISNILCDTIFVDNYSIVSLIMKNLISKGYTNFQFVGQINDATSFYERWLAFKNSLEEVKINVTQKDELLYFDPHLKPVVMELYRNQALPQVFVCANDMYAYYTREGLSDLGYVMNKDYIITGFDNTHQDLPLYATVDVPKEELGKRAVDQIIWRINNSGSPVEKKLIHADIIYNNID